ncbi:uncharacterized protein LOC144213190 isoform X2 [Stigmatopora nigra]
MNPQLLYIVVASAAASVLQGENQTQTARNHTSDALALAFLPTATMTTSWMLYHPDQILQNTSDVRSSTTVTQRPSTRGETTTASDQQHNSIEQKTTTPTEDITTVSATSPSVATQAAPPKDFSSSSLGTILLVLLLLVITILVIILYLLRRESRRYSFDLHTGDPNGVNTGNFEALSLNDKGSTRNDKYSGTLVDSEEEKPDLMEVIEEESGKETFSGFLC